MTKWRPTKSFKIKDIENDKRKTKNFPNKTNPNFFFHDYSTSNHEMAGNLKNGV